MCYLGFARLEGRRVIFSRTEEHKRVPNQRETLQSSQEVVGVAAVYLSEVIGRRWLLG